MNKAAAYVALSSLALSAALFAACDDDTVPLRDAPDGGGSDAASGADANVASGEVQQTGKIVILQQEGTGVGGATINIGGKTITADAKGNYSVTYPINTPVDMVVTAPNYYKLLEGQWLLKASASRGPTRLPSVDTVSALLSALALAGPVDTTLGIVSVWVIPLAGCPSEGGATFDVSPKTDKTKFVFTKNEFPDTTLTSAVAGENPHAVIYNIPIGQPVTITVNHPTCSQLPYPQTDSDGFTYTGKVNIAADNQTLGFFRLFLGPHVDVDAGTDAGVDSGPTDAGSDAADANDQ